MEFEAALTRLAGGMPRLSTDAFGTQEEESQVTFCCTSVPLVSASMMIIVGCC